MMKPLTTKQKEMLAYAADRGFVPSGRYGYNTSWVRRLHERGLVRPGKAGSFDQDWPLTPAGRQAADEAAAEIRARFKSAQLEAASAAKVSRG